MLTQTLARTIASQANPTTVARAFTGLSALAMSRTVLWARNTAIVTVKSEFTSAMIFGSQWIHVTRTVTGAVNAFQRFAGAGANFAGLTQPTIVFGKTIAQARTVVTGTTRCALLKTVASLRHWTFLASTKNTFPSGCARTIVEELVATTMPRAVFVGTTPVQLAISSRPTVETRAGSIVAQTSVKSRAFRFFSNAAHFTSALDARPSFIASTVGCIFQARTTVIAGRRRAPVHFTAVAGVTPQTIADVLAIFLESWACPCFGRCRRAIL